MTQTQNVPRTKLWAPFTTGFNSYTINKLMHFILSTEHYPIITVACLWKFLQTSVLSFWYFSFNSCRLLGLGPLSPTWFSVWSLVQAETTTPGWSSSAWSSVTVLHCFFPHSASTLMTSSSLIEFLRRSWKRLNSFMTVKLVTTKNCWNRDFMIFGDYLVAFRTVVIFDNSISDALWGLSCLH